MTNRKGHVIKLAFSEGGEREEKLFYLTRLRWDFLVLKKIFSSLIRPLKTESARRKHVVPFKGDEEKKS